jgi:hypothetical protein
MSKLNVHAVYYAVSSVVIYCVLVVVHFNLAARFLDFDLILESA